MFKSGIKLVLAAALAATPVVVLPTVAQAQQPDTQRAYQAGYNNGANDRMHNKSLNLRTDNWHGVNLQAYQRGYQDGYQRASNGQYGNNGYGNNSWGHDDRWRHHHDDDDNRGAYNTDDRWRHHHDDDDNRGAYNGNNGYGYGNQGYYGGAQNNDTQRAYQAGYNNGVNDRSRNKALNLRTDNWHGVNLQAYQRGYEDGYRGGRAHRW